MADWKPGWNAKLEGERSLTAAREQDAARVKLTPKEKEAWDALCKGRCWSKWPTATELGTTDAIMDAIEEKGWIQGDYDVFDRVRLYYRLPSLDHDWLYPE